MTYPAIDSVLLPKRGKKNLPVLLVKMIHRKDRQVTCVTPLEPEPRRLTLPVVDVKKDYRVKNVVR